MHHVFTRRQLHDLVWAEPKTQLAKRLGLSDVGLAKACRRADVPIPERGGRSARRESGRCRSRCHRADSGSRTASSSDGRLAGGTGTRSTIAIRSGLPISKRLSDR